MCRMKGIIITFLFSVSLILFGCTYQPEYFSKEELEGYSAPIVFLESAENEKKYFMMSDDPDSKVYLEYSKIWDFDPDRRTFLFSMIEDGEKGIYEYDLKNGSYKCLIEESSLSQYLQISNEEDIEAVYYRLSSDEVSGVYGNTLFIYNKATSEYIYTMDLPDVSWGRVYGWLDENTFLFTNLGKAFEINIETGKMIELENNLGHSIHISADKTVGCSNGDENWFGVSFSPILFWDTADYNIKRFHEGINTSAHLGISDDHKYILFVRDNDEDEGENDQLLCIRIEDEKLCIFFESEDEMVDLLW